MTARNPRLFAFVITIGVAILAGLFTGWVAGATVDCESSTSDTSTTRSESETKPSNDVQERPTPSTSTQDNGPFGQESPSATARPQDEIPRDGSPRDRPAAPSSGLRPGSEDSAGGIGGSDLAASAHDCGGSFSTPAAAVGFVGALLAGGVAIALMPLRRQEPATAQGRAYGSDSYAAVGASTGTFPVIGSAPLPQAPTPPVSAPASEQSQCVADRSRLIDALIYVRDRATSQAIADRVREELRMVGVQEVSPVGAVFDPALHEAGGFVAAQQAVQDGTIAAVETVGYVDKGGVLRPPVVTVFRAGQS